MGVTWGDVYDNTVGRVLPKKPDDPNNSAAGKAETAFASGLGNERSNFTPTSAPTVVEGPAPPPADQTGPSTGDLSGFGPGGKAIAKYASQHGGALPNGVKVNGSSTVSTGPDTQTQYADPTGLNNQNFALGLDKAAAEGTAPSAAEQLYRKGTDEGMSNALALAATTQGENPGMAQRAGLSAAQQVALNNAAGAGALRAQEMAQARGDYGNLATQTRGQTLQNAQANQAANIQQQLANNSFYLGLTDEQQKALATLMGGAIANSQNQQKNNAANQEFFGNLLSSGGKGAAGAAGGGSPSP